MGQYYKPTLIDNAGTVATLYWRDFNNAAKLMEHSYIGNQYVNAVLALAENNPMQVAWIGDYSDDPYKDLYAKALPHEEFMRYYRAAWREEDKHKLPCSSFATRKLNSILTLCIARKYLVNHPKQQYIHFGEYIAANKWTEQGLYENGKYDPLATYDMCINPLPLLTACGNNRGGGDYYDTHPDYDKVGLWAFNVIEYTAKEPKGYEKVAFTFSEKTIAMLAKKNPVS